MKHLKVKAKIWSDERYFDLEILEQSHLEHDFGGGQQIPTYMGKRRTRSDWKLFIHQDIILCSNYKPVLVKMPRVMESWGFDHEKYTMLQLKGSSGGLKPIIQKIPSHLWPKIKAAVIAYNEFYKES